MAELTPEWFSWVLAVFATYRLAYMLTIENGPAHIFAIMRASVARRYGPESWQAEGTTCFWCQSVWYGALFAIFIGPHNLEQFILLWLSISGAAGILHWGVLLAMAWVNRAG